MATNHFLISSAFRGQAQCLFSPKINSCTLVCFVAEKSVSSAGGKTMLKNFKDLAEKFIIDKK